MKVSTRNIKQINSRLEYLYDNFNIDPTDKKRKIGDEDIHIDFLDEWDGDNSYYSVEDFMRYTNGLNNIQTVNNHSAISGNIRQTIVDFDDYYYEHLVRLNEFMAKLCKCHFVWNSRQNKGLQLR